MDFSDSTVSWTEDGAERMARWRSGTQAPAPRRVSLADDRTRADDAFRLASQGTALLWRGDFHNARQLLQALARRIDRKPVKARPDENPFHVYRQQQAQRARILGMLLIGFNDDYVIPLRRAPDVAQACTEALGAADGPFVMSLRELGGIIGAHEWRKKGVYVPALDARVHPHYGVFSPVRGEYVDLVAQAPMPDTDIAIDVGTGTGILAAILAHRGIRRVVATDLNPAALACARENLHRLGLDNSVEVIEADLYPPERAGLIVCNPPWIPARPSSPLEAAVYDPGGRMLQGFIQGLSSHLTPGGEGWLVLSDIAEHLNLRSRNELLSLFEEAGLRVLGRLDARPEHPRARDASDPLHAARAAETTSLWRLGAS